MREPSLEEPGLPKARSGGGSWIIAEGTRTTGSGGHPKSPSMAGEDRKPEVPETRGLVIFTLQIPGVRVGVEGRGQGVHIRETVPEGKG